MVDNLPNPEEKPFFFYQNSISSYVLQYKLFKQFSFEHLSFPNLLLL